MTLYERFEQIVLIILGFIISLVVLFGMIMILLIAIEFKHSTITVLER